MHSQHICKYNRAHSESNLTGCPECSRDHWRAMFDDTCGELERLRGLAKLAVSELTMMADDLKNSCTVGGEWDGSETEAQEEYERIMEMAAKLAS